MQDKEIYIQERNAAKMRIREIKEDFWEKFTSDMENDLYGSQKRVWKMLRNRKAEVAETVKINVINQNEWERYFQQLYQTTDSSEEHNELENDEDNPSNAVDITEEVVKKTLVKLKNRKAPGPDGIFNEFLKYGGDNLNKQLTILINKIIKEGRIPKEWKTSTTIPIFKKGRKSDPDNLITVV